MTKGKARASQHHGNADCDVSHVPTHNVQELENLECDSPRYTVRQLSSRLLCMAYLDKGMFASHFLPNALP